MGVSIKLNTNFAFRDTSSEDFSLPSEVKTISDLLRHISQKIGFDLIDPDSGELEIDLEKIRTAINEFSGVQRRFQIKGEAGGVVVVDDYGHHPTEIKATLAAAKEGSGRRVIAVFQPHRYTRTQHLLTEFFTSFNEADVVIIMDIYPAGEQPIPGVTGEAVYEGIKRHGHKDIVFIHDRDSVVRHVGSMLQEGDILLTLGAGDVWKVGEQALERIRSSQRPGKGKRPGT